MVNNKKIRKTRKDAKLTTVALAKIIGGSTRTISEIENGKRQPSISTLEKIAAALKTPASFFLENISEEEEEKVA